MGLGRLHHAGMQRSPVTARAVALVCSCRQPAHQGSRRAVAQGGPMAGAAGLHLPAHCRSDQPADPPPGSPHRGGRCSWADLSSRFPRAWTAVRAAMPAEHRGCQSLSRVPPGVPGGRPRRRTARFDAARSHAGPPSAFASLPPEVLAISRKTSCRDKSGASYTLPSARPAPSRRTCLVFPATSAKPRSVRRRHRVSKPSPNHRQERPPACHVDRPHRRSRQSSSLPFHP